jgi:hypothetical protein
MRSGGYRRKGKQKDGEESPGMASDPGETRTPIPFDIEKCTLTLWALEC